MNKTLLIFLGLELVFVATGGLLLAAALIFKPTSLGQPGPFDEGTLLLLRNVPLTGAIANAILVFVTFLVAIPGVLRSNDRAFLKAHSWLLVACGTVSLIVGLIIWIGTLQTRANLGSLYGQQTQDEQSALQQQFNCCGYFDAQTPPFITDKTCPNVLAAARLGPCIGPFSAFANNVLDIVFTAMFGLTGIDALLFMSTAVMLNKRDEMERYRIIDQKHGYGGI